MSNQFQSDDISEITTAIVSAKQAYTAIEKNKTVKVTTKSGGSYTFDYADLECVFNGINMAMFENELTITQLVNFDSLVTILSHSSGQWLRSFTPLVRGNLSAQEYGSEITYMKRYAICAIAGVTAEDDDDGNAASGNQSEKIKDDLPWFNDFDKKKLQMQAMVNAGERTPKQLLDNLRKTYKVNKDVSEKISSMVRQS